MGNSLSHLIIGAGAAGMAAATAIREGDPDAAVRMLSEEDVRPYFRPMIPFIISGKKTPSQVSLAGVGPYADAGIDIRINTRAVKTDPAEKTVTTSNGEVLVYDRLLVATGSSPYIPPDIGGTDMEGVYALRTLAQAQHAAERASWAKSAVMLGGGLLNLKAAFALLEKKIAVTLVVKSPEILSQLMEPRDAAMIRTALMESGLRIITGRGASKIVGGNRGVCAVFLDDGTELAGDMVFIGKGVRPNTAFLSSTGLDVKKGVPVNVHTETAIPGIFAAGDTAVTFDPVTGESIVTGLWTNAVEMGRCAGKNMAGIKSAYTGTFGVMNATQVAGLPFVSMGIVHPDKNACEVHTASSSDSYLKLVFSQEGDRLLGLVMIGRIEKAGLYRYIIRERRDISPLKDKIIRQRLHAGDLAFGRH